MPENEALVYQPRLREVNRRNSSPHLTRHNSQPSINAEQDGPRSLKRSQSLLNVPIYPIDAGEYGKARKLLKDNGLWEKLSKHQLSIVDFMDGNSGKFPSFEDAHELHEFVQNAEAMTELIHSVFEYGLLSAQSAADKGLMPQRSADTGLNKNVHVNVLGIRNKSQTAEEVTEESMTTESRGSFSVVMERHQDPLQEQLLELSEKPITDDGFQAWLEKMNLSEEDRKQFKSMFLNRYKEERAEQQESEFLSGHKAIKSRVMNTLMAVMTKPGELLPELRDEDGSYEGFIEGDISGGGRGGFNVLLVPQWLEPFHAYICDRRSPNVEIKYVGTKTITANYQKKRGDNIPVTVGAPDYVSEVAPLLDKFEVVATHILKGPTII